MLAFKVVTVMEAVMRSKRDAGAVVRLTGRVWLASCSSVGLVGDSVWVIVGGRQLGKIEQYDQNQGQNNGVDINLGCKITTIIVADNR